MEYSIIDNEQDFIFLEKLWKEMEDKCQNSDISVSFNWCLTWWKIFKKRENNTFGYNKKLVILVGKNNGCIEVIMPLIQLERRISFVKIQFVEFLGQQWGGYNFFFINKGFCKF